MRMAALFALVLSIALSSAAQEQGKNTESNEVQYGAQAYRDAHTGIIIYVESDARHVSAISPTGKLLWTRDPFKDAHLQLYRTKHPQIARIVRGPNVIWIPGKPHDFVSLVFNSSQFGLLRLSDGEFFIGGED